MRARTIALAAAGLLVAALLVFVMFEVKGGGSSAGSGGGDDPAAGRDRPRRSAAAQRPAPTPRGDRSGDPEAGDPEADEPRTLRAGGVAGSEMTRRLPRDPIGAAVGPAAGAGAAPEGPITSNADPEQDEKMAAATASYDSGDYQSAHEKALAILETSPRNIKMLRIAVSTSCMFGELDRARELNARLPKGMQEQMRRRCKKNGGDL